MIQNIKLFKNDYTSYNDKVIFMDRQTQKIETYLNEYNIVINKITALSLKFANGSYIIPIGLFVGLASIKMDYESIFINAIFIALPIILSFYLYNHIRYMSLQFKLSGYAKHLENKINEILEDKILLWENSIARNNKQNYYEGMFLGVIYVCIMILIHYTAYNNLAAVIYRNRNFYGIAILITAIYYYLVALIIFFLLFFMNEHNNTFRLATSFNAIVLTNFQKKHTRVKKFTRSNITKIMITLILILLMPSALFPLTYFSKYSAISIEKHYDYIVVLGNKSNCNEPSEDMKVRLNCLVDNIDYFQNSTIILSGGNGEANLMKDFLVDNDITQNTIILEETSQNTRENLSNTRYLASGNVLVITSDYHVFRTRLISNRLNLDWDVMPAKTNNFKFLKSLRECYAIYFEYLLHIRN